MPYGNEGENNPDIVLFVFGSSQGNKDVSDEPLIESSVPVPPKDLVAVAIIDTSAHVFGSVDSVEQGPRPGDPPDAEELEPEEKHVETVNLISIESWHFNHYLQVSRQFGDGLNVQEEEKQVK